MAESINIKGSEYEYETSESEDDSEYEEESPTVEASTKEEPLQRPPVYDPDSDSEEI